MNISFMNFISNSIIIMRSRSSSRHLCSIWLVRKKSWIDLTSICVSISSLIPSSIMFVNKFFFIKEIFASKLSMSEYQLSFSYLWWFCLLFLFCDQSIVLFLCLLSCLLDSNTYFEKSQSSGNIILLYTRSLTIRSQSKTSKRNNWFCEYSYLVKQMSKLSSE